MEYRCTCGAVFTDGRSLAGHISGGRKRGEQHQSAARTEILKLIVQGKTREEIMALGYTSTEFVSARRAIPKGKKNEVTSEKVADALLLRVVDALTKHDELQIRCSTLESENQELRRELKEVGEEKDRILKIHNEQVRSRQLTNSVKLIHLAKL